jgi:hypothetical protein
MTRDRRFRSALSRVRNLLGSAILICTLAVVPSAVWAQTNAAQPPATATVPTTKILAIGRLTPKWTPAARGTVMPAEVRATVALYLGGKIDQWYVRQDQPGVVFILNTTDPKEAREMLEKLPLGQAGLMEFDLIPLGPLSPLRLLISPPPG